MNLPFFPDHTTVWKAHATGNSFIIVDNPRGHIAIDEAATIALCDPNKGIGADGVIVTARRDGLWFMDYRNADGSIAEMCGNGIRAFVDHLRRRGYIDLSVGQSVNVLTRGGVRPVQAVATPSGADAPSDGQQWYEVDMGKESHSDDLGMLVALAGQRKEFRARRVYMPNPHAVVILESREALNDALIPPRTSRPVPDTSGPLAPRFTPHPPEGTNLELVVNLTSDGDAMGHLLMRVCERGVGETFSCGTGCCASAVAAALEVGEACPSTWMIDVLGGRVFVRLGETVKLIGPAAPIAQIIVQ